MKIISIIKRSILLLLPAVALLVGCNEPDPDSISVVDSVTEEPITIIHADAQSGEYYFKVLSDKWSVTSSEESWCVPQKDAGYEYGEVSSVYIREYEGAEDSRTATLTFRSGMASHVVMVSQLKSSELLSLYPSSSTISYRAQTLSFVVNATLGWSVSSSVSWATATANSDGTVTLTVDENDSSTESREAIITVLVDNSDGSAVSTTTATYVLTQESRSDLYLTPSVPSYTFTADGGQIAVDLYTNIYEPEYTVSAISSNGTEWCTATYSDATGLVITAAENIFQEGRAATVTIIARSENGIGTETITSTISVAQDGISELTLSLGMSSYVYDKEAGSHSVSYYTNATNAFATSNSDWITITSESSSQINFSLSENEGASVRQGIITITTTMGGVIMQDEITIYQNGVGDLELQISPDEIFVDENGGESLVVVLSNSADITSANVQWIFPDNGWVSGKVYDPPMAAVVYIDENTTLYERECLVVVLFAYGDQTIAKGVTIYQEQMSDTPSFDTEE